MRSSANSSPRDRPTSHALMITGARKHVCAPSRACLRTDTQTRRVRERARESPHPRSPDRQVPPRASRSTCARLGGAGAGVACGHASPQGGRKGASSRRAGRERRAPGIARRWGRALCSARLPHLPWRARAARRVDSQAGKRRVRAKGREPAPGAAWGGGTLGEVHPAEPVTRTDSLKSLGRARREGEGGRDAMPAQAVAGAEVKKTRAAESADRQTHPPQPLARQAAPRAASLAWQDRGGPPPWQTCAAARGAAVSCGAGTGWGRRRRAACFREQRSWQRGSGEPWSKFSITSGMELLGSAGSFGFVDAGFPVQEFQGGTGRAAA